MRIRKLRPVNHQCLLTVAGVASLLVMAMAAVGAEKQAYSLEGIFLEGCSCSLPCPCELVGVEKGCEGVGAMSLSGGKFNGVNLSGVKIAYAVAPGDWVRLYVDAPQPEQRKAAEEFAKAYYREWGKLEATKEARIEIAGKDGHYTLTVDEGKIMELKTEPVLGGDNKTPIKISNTKSALNPTFLQGRTLSGKFKDGSHSFKLKDSNSYFSKLKAKGEV